MLCGVALARDPKLIDAMRGARILSQCDFPGGIFSIDLHGGRRAAFDFLRNLKIGRNAVSLGGVETLACHPRTTTHSTYTPAEADEAGITEGLVRISVGIEDWRDLLSDFQQALEAI
jgi:cystathionine beta-lyase/cystathionine gamma-synthase